tara:strand:- start:91 stop:1584 length:1494 start_codon:yes stop_codon:yes gene_type:complete
MAKQLSKSGISTNDAILAWHVTQSVDAFTGTDAYDVTVSGSLTITGSTSGTFTGSFTGSFDGLIPSASYAATATSASYAATATSASYALTASFLEGSVTSASYAATASYILASNIDQPFTDITASGNISASGNINADYFLSDGIQVVRHNFGVNYFGKTGIPTELVGNVTASGNISASGDLRADTLRVGVTNDNTNGLLISASTFNGDARDVQIIYPNHGLHFNSDTSNNHVLALADNNVGIRKEPDDGNALQVSGSISIVDGDIFGVTNITASGNISSSGIVSMLTASIGGGIFTSASLAGGGGGSGAGFPFTGDAVITGSLVVSASATSQSLSVIGSGSTVFDIIGSAGTLFSVDDSLTGTIFSSNDISGLPILQVDSTGEVYLGKSPQSLYTTAIISATSASSTASLTSLSTSSYDGAFFDYTITSASNARAGSIMSVWNGGTVSFTETTTTDIGSTSGLDLQVIISESQAQLVAITDSTSPNIYKVKTIIKAI